MSKPIPGKSYTVISGDNLSVIARKAYGDGSLWPRIFKANQNTLKSDDPNLIFPGEVLIIPLISERNTATLKEDLSKMIIGNKAADDFTLIVDNREVPVKDGKIIRTMDTAADGWSASIAWNPGEDKRLDKILLPYAYPTASVYLGRSRLVNGLLYIVGPEITKAGIVKALQGFSFTADVIDSSIKPPYEKNNITFEQRAKDLVLPLGINIIFETDTGGPFKRITANPTDTIFSHLAKLATQRGVLISSNTDGDLLITKANLKGTSVAVLEETQPLPIGFKATFNGRARFNVYKAIGQSPGGNAKTAIAKDNGVPRSRFLTFQANDTTSGDIQKAAKWRRSKQLADALTIPFPVSSWRDPSGNLWQENTIVTAKSKTINVPNGFNFLIRSVEFNYGTSGKTAVLNIVPPQVYSGEEIKSPWEVG